MRDIRNVLDLARKDGVALGHFNVADSVLLKAVFSSAQELAVPVLVGVSEGERDFVGVRQIAALVRSFREEFDFPVFLNADHTHTLEKAIEAARSGFDTVVFDASALPFEENARQTKEAVETLKSINSAILVEGEIGNIGTGSEIHELSADLSKYLTTPSEARQFVESRELTSWLRQSATCTGCPGRWLPEKRRSTWISRESVRSGRRHEFSLLCTADREPMIVIYSRPSRPG